VNENCDAPQQIFLDINLECNLHCIQCDLHRSKNPQEELTLEERKQLIDEISVLYPGSNLVLSGSEPFMRREHLYELACLARDNGLYTTISTNGTLISDDDIRKLPKSGINDIVVSLDSHVASVHDGIRGVRGCFNQAVQSIRKLVEARNDSKTDFHVLTSTILGAHNLSHIHELVAYLELLDVDTSMFQPIQPVFNRQVEPDWQIKSPLFPKDLSSINYGIDNLIECKRKGKRLYQQEYQFEDMRYYFLNGATVRSQQCISAKKNLMIDIIGNVRFCFNMERIGLSPIGNVRKTPLEGLWSNNAEMRSKMDNCQECCGVMICHAR